MELTLVANPAAGSGTDVEMLEQALKAHGATVRTVSCSDADDWVRSGTDPDALLAGSRRVVVAGGDGSVGSAAALAAAAGAVLAVIPAGTANDFARHLDLPLDEEAACALAADPGAATRALDLAWMGERPFLNAASAGLSVDAAAAASPLKKMLGPAAYPAGAVRAAVGSDPFDCTVRCDGEVCFEGEVWQVTVASTGAFGGGAEIGDLDTGDGVLDVALLTGSRLGLAGQGAAMRSGDLLERDDVVHLRGREVVVEGPAEWNVDGELLEHDGASFRIEPRAVDVVVPA